MALSQSPVSGSLLVGAYGVNPSWEEWKFDDYSIYTGFDNSLKIMTSIPMTFPAESSPAPSPYYCGSSTSDYSTPSPTSPNSIPVTPVTPTESSFPRFHQRSVTSTPQTSTKPKIAKEDLTPKQLKRRLQNRVSQQAVRRRRNSPARILETRLQELDRQQSSLMELYTANIDSCIQTLSNEIETLKELKELLATGSVVPARFNSLLLKTGGGVLSTVGLGAGANGVSAGVDQSPAYQNHDFNSGIPGGLQF